MKEVIYIVKVGDRYIGYSQHTEEYYITEHFCNVQIFFTYGWAEVIKDRNPGARIMKVKISIVDEDKN